MSDPPTADGEAGRFRRPSTGELLERLRDADREAVEAVDDASDTLSEAVDAVVRGWRRGGRLIYVGSGTSGRIGALDAVECPPTFGVPPERVTAVVAGGRQALWRAVEAAEDDEAAGARSMDRRKVGDPDVVVGISASGTTPFTCAAVERARERGAVTVGLTGTPGRLATAARIPVILDTGTEIVEGSTRLKAGTAQKLACNTLTTAAFVRLGRVIDGRMVAVGLGSAKLRRRAAGILVELGAASDEQAAESLLSRAGDDLPAALLMGIRGVDRQVAVARLEACDGDVLAALRGGDGGGDA